LVERENCNKGGCKAFMILKDPIPFQIREKFLQSFGVELETYWEEFWGWEKSSRRGQFLMDFPALSDDQQLILQELIDLEKEQFEEWRRKATIMLDVEEHSPLTKYRGGR